MPNICENRIKFQTTDGQPFSKEFLDAIVALTREPDIRRMGVSLPNKLKPSGPFLLGTESLVETDAGTANQIDATVMSKRGPIIDHVLDLSMRFPGVEVAMCWLEPIDWHCGILRCEGGKTTEWTDLERTPDDLAKTGFYLGIDVVSLRGMPMTRNALIADLVALAAGEIGGIVASRREDGSLRAMPVDEFYDLTEANPMVWDEESPIRMRPVPVAAFGLDNEGYIESHNYAIPGMDADDIVGLIRPTRAEKKPSKARLRANRRQASAKVPSKARQRSERRKVRAKVPTSASTPTSGPTAVASRRPEAIQPVRPSVEASADQSTTNAPAGAVNTMNENTTSATSHFRMANDLTALLEENLLDGLLNRFDAEFQKATDAFTCDFLYEWLAASATKEIRMLMGHESDEALDRLFALGVLYVDRFGSEASFHRLLTVLAGGAHDIDAVKNALGQFAGQKPSPEAKGPRNSFGVGFRSWQYRLISNMAKANGISRGQVVSRAIEGNGFDMSGFRQYNQAGQSNHITVPMTEETLDRLVTEAKARRLSTSAHIRDLVFPGRGY